MLVFLAYCTVSEKGMIILGGQLIKSQILKLREKLLNINHNFVLSTYVICYLYRPNKIPMLKFVYNVYKKQSCLRQHYKIHQFFVILT